MESWNRCLKVFRVQTQRLLFLVGVVAITHLSFQFLLLPYGKALRSLLPDVELPVHDESGLKTLKYYSKSVTIRYPLTVNASDLITDSLFKGSVEDGGNSKFGSDSGNDSGLRDVDINTKDGFASAGKDQDNPIELVTDREVDDDSVFEVVESLNDMSELEINKIGEHRSMVEPAGKAKQSLPLEQFVKPSWEVAADSLTKIHASQSPTTIKGKRASSIVDGLENITNLKNEVSNASPTVGSVVAKNDLATSINISAMISTTGKKKMKCEMPPKTITSILEMNETLIRHRRSSRAMRPRWSSIRDQEILAARKEIEKAPFSGNDRELYAPLFRNVSMFKRSYELMDRTLKVYVYREGKKPIFHQPVLKGLYASEGWFMKLMEGNKRFVVKDPRKAHLFYMPFSSRMLEYTLYVRNSHNRTNLRQYLKEYAESIAAKYRYWNRTGGADHFLVACHDWAPYETRHHMEHCIKALCNADVTAGFKLGRDVSLPETYVRSARNPLRDLGGKPPSQRHVFAFYAGNMHGYLRPILLKYWKDKDPSMQIFGPMPPGVASKMNYIQHMKSSKYCICPKGYEVNSPRVVESIFYECVPVIVSDNFVPPFFEVLNWEAFSVIIAEKDIPNLKDILLSIPEEKYIQMQLAVAKLQRHFLWHAKPEKYDLFHMTLHSIWNNRVHQLKPR